MPGRIFISYRRVDTPAFAGRRGNPVLIDRHYFPHLLALTSGLPPRELLRQYQAGFQANQQGDYATAHEKLVPLAEQGSSAAQIFVGFMYENAQGVPKDEAAAANWYREAAERDNMIAQVRLAIIYRDGRGVPQDSVKALAWASMAARGENHMQSIAKALQRKLKAGMTAEEIAAGERLFQEHAAKR